MARAVDGFLPTGPDARTWMRWQNEAQMLFFQHPVNRARETAGRPTIGGVWTWGGGCLPQVPDGPSLTIADHPLAVGLARASGGRVLGLDVLAGPFDDLSPTSLDPVLAFWDRLWWPTLEGDWDAWGAAVAELEILVDRLLADLKSGRIRSLTLDDGAGRQFGVARGSLHALLAQARGTARSDPPLRGVALWTRLARSSAADKEVPDQS